MFTNVTVRALAAALAVALVAACSSGDDADDAEPAEAATSENDEGGTPADPGLWVVEAPRITVSTRRPSRSSSARSSPPPTAEGATGVRAATGR